MPNDLPSAPVTISLYLNAHTTFPAGQEMSVQVTNDSEINQTFFVKTPTVNTTLPFHDGPGDIYRVLVNVDGYGTSGIATHADPKTHQLLSMLMIPHHAKPTFPAWADLKGHYPLTARLIGGGVTEAETEARYTSAGTAKPLALACLMNLSAAMGDIGLGGGTSPLDFIKEVIWDDTLAQDRFFGWVDPAIIPLVRAAAAESEFAQEPDPGLLHPGSTLSYKQTAYDYSNVQLTFHEQDTLTIGGVPCIRIEPDMDLYKDLLAHGLGEVIPNRITGGKTNPLAVLALRWIDAVTSNQPLFDPGYVLS